MFSRCLTTRVNGFDQPPLQIMQTFFCFVNNKHVDLLWEGLHYSLEHPSTLIPYPRFSKLIVSHYMNAFPEISRRARDKYHNLEDDMMVKNIFNLEKHKDGVGSQPIESTHGTHRTTNALRSPNPDVDEGESSAPQKSTIIRLRIPQRQPTRLTLPTSIPTTVDADDIILQDKIQLSLAEQKSHDELEANQNVQNIEEHLIANEIKKPMEGTKNESKKEILVSPHPQKPTPVVQSSQRDPKAHVLSLVNEDLLYLKKGNLGPEKILLSLHEFPAVIFPDDDIEERTSRWVDKRLCSGWTAMVIVSLHQKYRDLGKTIEKYKILSIVFEPIYGIIYKNNKKEKRVMRHQEVYKFCDATLKRSLGRVKKPFEEEIEKRLKHYDQIRRWEMYVNGRPLGSRKERLE
nr:hypothetical protein [Tanacetum cinerariifolium]